MYTILLRKHGKPVFFYWDSCYVQHGIRFVINLLHIDLFDALGMASLSLWIWMLRVDCQLEAFEFNCWLHIKCEVVYFLISQNLSSDLHVTWSTYLQQRNSLWVSSLRWLHVYIRLRSHSALLALPTKFHRETVDTFLFLCTFVACDSTTIIRIAFKAKWADGPDLFILGSSSWCINTRSAGVAFAPSRELTLLLIVP